MQHMDIGEQLASYDKQENIHYGSIVSVKTWGSILFRMLKYDEFDDDCVGELNPVKLEECRRIYETVSQDDLLNSKLKATPKSKIKSPVK